MLFLFYLNKKDNISNEKDNFSIRFDKTNYKLARFDPNPYSERYQVIPVT